MSFLKSENGAALISVLLLVAVMSAAMVVSFDVLGYYTRSTIKNQQELQAYEFALAGEIVGAEQAKKLTQQIDLANFLNISANENRVSFPVDNGSVSGSLKEKSNCFNLVSLVKAGSGNRYEINEIAYEQFIRLLQGLGIGERQAVSLSSALVDWQDSDGRPMSSGNEDYTYSRREVPYHTANTLITDITELRIVNGYNENIIAALRPYVCIDHIKMDTVINLNTIEVDQAILVQAMLGIPLSIQDVMAIIKDRPDQGYDHVARFWAHPFLENREISQEVRNQFNIKPKRYEIIIDVRLTDARVHLKSLISMNDDGSYSLISRKFGV